MKRLMLLVIGSALVALATPATATPLTYMDRPYSGQLENCVNATVIDRMSIQCYDTKNRKSGVRLALDRDPYLVYLEQKQAWGQEWALGESARQAALEQQRLAQQQQAQQQELLRQQTLYAAQLEALRKAQERAHNQQGWARLNQTFARIQQQSQQQFQAGMAQIQNTNAMIGYQTYSPVQRPDSTWVRCIRTSSYTAY